MKLQLSQQQYEYLKSNLFKEKIKLFEKLEKSRSGANSFDLAERWADSIREWSCDKLQMVGFDRDYNPTPAGIILEDLIDVFFSG